MISQEDSNAYDVMAYFALRPEMFFDGPRDPDYVPPKRSWYARHLKYPRRRVKHWLHEKFFADYCDRW